MKTEKLYRQWRASWSGCLSAGIFSLPVLIGICTILSSWWLWQEASDRERIRLDRARNREFEQHLQLAAGTVKTEIESQLDTRVTALSQMVKRWHQGGFSRREWAIASQAYMDFDANCQTMQWINTSFRSRWTLSRDGIEPPERNLHQQILAPYANKWPKVIVVPATSPQGSRQLWVYIPLFYGENLGGFLFAAYPTEELFKTILHSDIVPQYGLKVFERETEIFKRDTTDVNAETPMEEIDWHWNNITWRSQIWLNFELPIQERSQLPQWLLGLGVLVSASLTINFAQSQQAWKQARQAKTTNFSLKQEIAKRKRTESQLQQHVQTIDLAHDAIIIRDMDDAIIYWNQGAERLYGWKKSEVAGKYIHKLLQTVFPQPLEEIVAICFRQGYWQGELLHSKRDGVQITVASRWTVQRDENGQPSAILSINNDISDRKQTEEILHRSERQMRQQAMQLEETLRELKNAQAQLIQSEKMSSLGQLVAGVAHEINNPVNFIYGNLSHANEYTRDLLMLIQLYQQEYPNPTAEIEAEVEAIELDFLVEDLPKLLASMKVGAERIREIVQSLRNFSRLDESQMKEVDIHEGIDSTLMILQNRLKAKSDRAGIELIKEYGNLPKVECYVGQLNQVFMNLLTNAIDVLEESMKDEGRRINEEVNHFNPSIWIRTKAIDDDWVKIAIADNGSGMAENVLQQLFDPFFTTKPIGKGTGLGLSISYQIIVEKHGGKLECYSQPGLGAEFAIAIPIRQSRLIH